MKPFLLTIFLFLLCSPMHSFAQIERFEVNEHKVSWNASYPSLITQEQLIKQMKLSGDFEQVEAVDNKIVARLINLRLDSNSYAEPSFWGRPSFIVDTHWYAFVTISMEAQIAKIKVSNMYCKYLKETKENEDGTVKVGSIYEFESVFYNIQKNELSGYLLKDGSQIIDGNFNALFMHQLALKDLNN